MDEWISAKNLRSYLESIITLIHTRRWLLEERKTSATDNNPNDTWKNFYLGHNTEKRSTGSW